RHTAISLVLIRLVLALVLLNKGLFFQLTEEKRVLEEQQRRASEELIQRLLEEEKELLQEEKRKRQEDERLARLLSTQLNSAPVPQQNLRPDVTAAQKKKEVGQIERFLCPRAPPTCSLQSNKENILVSEGALQPELPHLDYYGPQTELRPLQEEDQLTTPGGPSAKRKNSELDTTEEEVNDITKRRCHPSSLEAGLVLQGAAQRETELQDRWQQEEEDRRLALLLQKELDKEERQKAIDRRKGSANAHLLRQRRQTRNEAGSSGTKSLNRVESTSSSSASPKTSPFRSRKQKTLTEMFSSLSS
uniref:Ring finger protein 168 n=1 Tax=Acanthochromis polyacanthus TaxID=80966 RepID=A0A3Q1EAT8_9TELE